MKLTLMISDLMGIVMGNLIYMSYFELVWRKKRLPRGVYTGTYILTGAIMLLLTRLFIGTPYMPFCLPVILLMISFLYESSICSKLMHELLLLLVCIISEMFTILILQIVHHVSVKAVQNEEILYFVAVSLSNFLVFVLLKSITILLKRQDYDMNRSVGLGLSLFPASSVISLVMVVLFLSQVEVDSYYTGFTFVAVSFMILANIAIFMVVEYQAKLEADNRSAVFVERQLNQQREHYRELYAVQDETRKIRHDMKNNLIALQGYLHNGMVLESEKMLDSLVGEIRDLEGVVSSGYPALDAVIGAKNTIAAKEKIRLERHLVLDRQILIPEMDLALLLATALDNSLEAEQKEEEGKRWIKLELRTYESYLVLRVQNYVSQIFSLKNLCTNKPDKLWHGYGLKTIRSIAEKYDGDIHISCENQIFCVDVMLRNTFAQ